MFDIPCAIFLFHKNLNMFQKKKILDGYWEY